MRKVKNKHTFYLITSKTFWVGAPIVISKIIEHGHYVSVFDESNLPSANKLLECDALIDMSSITRRSFYETLAAKYKENKSCKMKVPLMVDPPTAVLNSIDKRKTHKIFNDLVPESYNLNGKNNLEFIEKFKMDKYIVLKPVDGWWGKGVVRMSPVEATNTYAKTRDYIIQKYIHAEGVGRIVTFNYKADFEIACSYLRVSKYWRTGTDVSYKCVSQPINKKLRDFAKVVSKRCGLYFNGIDYIYANGKYILLEVNAVPAIKEPYDEFEIDVASMLLEHIERNLDHEVS